MSKDVQLNSTLIIKFRREDGEDIEEEKGKILMDYAVNHVRDLILNKDATESGTISCQSHEVGYVGGWVLEDKITFK